MGFQISGSRRQFLSAIAMTAGAAVTLGPRLAWAADMTDPRVLEIVAATIETHTLPHQSNPDGKVDPSAHRRISSSSVPVSTFQLDRISSEQFQAAP
jgi:hypothetical protein